MAQLIDDVELADEFHPVRVELKVLRRASLALFVGELWAEGGKDTGLLLLGHLLAGVAAPCDLCDFVAGDMAEALRQARDHRRNHRLGQRASAEPRPRGDRLAGRHVRGPVTGGRGHPAAQDPDSRPRRRMPRLYMLAKTKSGYQPALDAGPGTWMLALRYTDTGSPGRKGKQLPGWPGRGEYGSIRDVTGWVADKGNR